MTSPDPEDALQSFIEQVLRDQPPLRAPEHLSTRVLAAIERREIRLQNRSDFRSWMPSARVAFCIVSLGAIASVMTAWSWFFDALGSSAPPSISRELALLQAVVTIGTSLAHGIPVHWLYVALGAIAAMYVAFFGIGAAAYRALYEQR